MGILYFLCLVAYLVVSFCGINFMFLRDEGHYYKDDTLQLGLAVLVIGLAGCLLGWLFAPFWLLGQLGHWVTPKIQRRSK